MPYSRPYASGFQDYPSTSTPINATALNTIDVGVKTANDQFQTVTTAQRTALSPTVGQCVWDSDLRQLMVYMNASGGNAWQPIGNVIICSSTTRPSTPYAGQRIFETDSKRMWTYIGSAFVPDDMVFTNEAARDAAITSPFEGQVAYLTAPTVPALTGDTYAVLPTGVRTIYNGSVWVCVTPIGATTNTTGTTTSTTWTATLTSGGTNPSVTLVTGTTARVSIYALAYAATNALRQIGISFAVSGATTLSPSGSFGSSTTAASTVPFGAYAYIATANVYYELSRQFVITGLTAGNNTFAMNYLTDNNTDTFANRSIVVEGVA